MLRGPSATIARWLSRSSPRPLWCPDERRQHHAKSLGNQEPMMKFDEVYRHELGERDRLLSAATVTIGVLAVVGGVLAALAQGAWLEWRLGSAIFLSLAAGAAVAYCVAIYHLVRCYHGHTYKILPRPLDCMRHREALRSWHASYGTPADAEADFANWLDGAYATAADANASTNWRRSGFLFKANGAAVAALVLSLSAAVPYLVHRASLGTPPIKVELTNAPAVAAGAATKETHMAEPKPDPPPPPPKPEPPPLRELREGQIPTQPGRAK